MPKKPNRTLTVRRPKTDRSLQTCHPTLAAEWRLDVPNGDVTPDRVLPASRFEAAWRCQTCGHAWTARVVDRTRKRSGCPACAETRRQGNTLAARFPDLAAQWDHERNPPDPRPDTIAWASNIDVAWTCLQGPDHQWTESPNKRTATGRNAKGQGGCPFCTNFRVSVTNSLATVRPDLAAQLPPDLNDGLTAEQITHTSTRQVQWRCEDGHAWPARVRDRTLQSGNCPFDTGHRLADDRTVAAVAPHLVPEWAQDLNGERTPYNTAAYSNVEVAWRKPDAPDEVWKARPADRVRGTGSPFLHGHRVSHRNSLAALLPDLAATWLDRGDRSPHEVTAQSQYVAWWRCPRDDGHAWPATVKNRVNGTDCPICNVIGLSRAQHRVAWELRYCFPDLLDGRTRAAVERLDVPGRQRKRCYREVDILLPSLQVAIEYDGRYWHQGKEDDDVRKTKELQAAGLRVLRLREKGLPLLSEDDLEIELDAGNKAPHVVAAAVLTRLLDWGLEVPKARDYMAFSRAVHQVEADAAWSRKRS